jgi:hypothetical protein
MTFGPEYPTACVSRFSTPINAHAQITTPPLFSGAIPTPVYEYSSRSGSIVSAISRIVTISAGIAVADPMIVAWQDDDFKLFPSDYASSLAQKIGITLAKDPVASTRLGPTSPAADEAAAGGLSTGAKAGIGVGVVLGAAIIGVTIILLYMRRGRKAETTAEGAGVAEMEDQDGHLGERKWFFGGRWRSEVNSVPVQNELDSKTVHVVPGPPAELDGGAPVREQEPQQSVHRDPPA